MNKYIIVKHKTHQDGDAFYGYVNFDELKKAVIDRLDGRGWDDKGEVNLKSIKSCIDYLHVDGQGNIHKLTSAFNKFYDCASSRSFDDTDCARYF